MTIASPRTLPVALDEVEAAALLGVHPRTLANWRYLGNGPPYVACGRRRTYRLEDLLSWQAARVVHPGAERAQ